MILRKSLDIMQSSQECVCVCEIFKSTVRFRSQRVLCESISNLIIGETIPRIFIIIIKYNFIYSTLHSKCGDLSITQPNNIIC